MSGGVHLIMVGRNGRPVVSGTTEAWKIVLVFMTKQPRRKVVRMKKVETEEVGICQDNIEERSMVEERNAMGCRDKR